MCREFWSSRIVEEVQAVHSEMILPGLLGGRFLMRNGHDHLEQAEIESTMQ